MLTLLYHNILDVPRDEWPVSYRQITAATFRTQVRRLKKHLLSPQAVADDLARGKRPRGVLLTFDDGAGGILRAAEILAEEKACGVSFVCPGTLQSGLWFYRLGDALARTNATQLEWEGAVLPLTSPKEKRTAYKAVSPVLFTLSPAKRDARLAEVITQLAPVGETPKELSILDEAGLRAATATGGMVLANHSWTHPDLTQLAPEEMASEIEKTARWLETSGLPNLPWLAFPRGVHNAAVREEAAKKHPVVFGASTYEVAPVIPRCYLCESDADSRRFALKTVADGAIYRMLEKRRQSQTAAQAVDV